MMWPDLPTELAMAEGNFQADLDRTMLTLFLFVHEDRYQHIYHKHQKMQPSNRKWRLKDVNHIEWMSYSTHIQYGNLMQSWEYGEVEKERRIGCQSVIY